MTRAVIGKLLLLSATGVGAIVFLALESGRGILSPRELGVALLILALALCAVAFSIVRRSAKGLTMPDGLSRDSIDAVTRNQRLWRIRMAKIRIAITGVALLVGLTQIRDFPVLPLLAGLALSILTITISVRTVLRLKSILD